MIADKIKDLAAARERVAELEEMIAADLKRELASLPAKYGFEDANAFFSAVRAALGERHSRKPGATNTSAAKEAGRRTKITAAMHAKVKRVAGQNKTGK